MKLVQKQIDKRLGRKLRWELDKDGEFNGNIKESLNVDIWDDIEEYIDDRLARKINARYKYELEHGYPYFF